MNRKQLTQHITKLEQQNADLKALLTAERAAANAYSEMHDNALRTILDTQPLAQGLYLALRLIRDMAEMDNNPTIHFTAQTAMAQYENAHQNLTKRP